MATSSGDILLHYQQRKLLHISLCLSLSLSIYLYLSLSLSLWGLHFFQNDVCLKLRQQQDKHLFELWYCRPVT